MVFICKVFIDYYAKRQYMGLLVTFSCPHMVEKVFIWGQIFEIEILMDLQVLRFLNPKITFLAVGECVCYQHNWKLNYSKNPNLVFYICIICRHYLKLFMSIEKKVCVYRVTQMNSNTLQPRMEFLYSTIVPVQAIKSPIMIDTCRVTLCFLFEFS